MQKLKLSWILIAAGVSVLCLFWFSSSRIEKPAMNESPAAASADDGKATIAVDIPETASEEIFQVSPDSPDSYPIEGGDNDDNSGELSDDKKKIEDIKCISPELPSLADTPPELEWSVSPFDYINSSDSDISERALAGDGEAQQFYATRLQSRLIGEYLQHGFDNDIERYRWAQEFKVMRNHFILAIKNRSQFSARLLGDTLFMNPLQKDRIDGGAWVYIYLMIAGDTDKKRGEAINYRYKLTEQEKRDSLLRAKKYIDLFDLWFLRPSAESKETLKAKFEVSAEEKSAEGFIDRIPDDCLHEYLQTLEEKDKKPLLEAEATTGFMADNETLANEAPDPYALALRQLRAYQADSAQHELMEFIDKEKEKEKASALHRRFEEIRILLISVLQTDNRKVLPLLIKMYLDYPQEYDPLEAVAWMEIGKAVYGYSNNQDGVTDYFGMTEKEFVRITAILVRQYISLYRLN